MKRELMKKIVFFSLSAFALFLPLHSLAVDDKYYGNRLVVKFKPVISTGKSQVMNADKLVSLSNSTREKLHHVRKSSNGIEVLQADGNPTPQEMDAMIKQLQARADVEFAEIDYKRYPAAFPNTAPNDPFYAQDQWYLQDNSNLSQRGATNVEAVWQKGLTGAGVTIGVVDTGITQHVELDVNGNIINGYDFIGFDPDGSSSTDSDGVSGRDNDATDTGDLVTNQEKININAFASDTSCKATTGSPPQSSWHGTLVSGVIAAKTNNNLGIAGVAPNAKILITRALGKCGGYNSDLMDAAQWSAGIDINGAPSNTTPAKIINLSLGGTGTCTQLEQAAIDAIVNKGSVVVVAAGNEGNDAAQASPGNCNNVINIAATTKRGGKTSYTNFGEEITLSAPGGNGTNNNILTSYQNKDIGSVTRSDNVIAEVNGTSFSAPIVSGIIALMLERKSDLTPDQIKALLIDNVTPFPTGTALSSGGDSSSDCDTQRCGAGIVNAKETINAIDSGDIPLPTPSITPAPQSESVANISSKEDDGGGGSTTLAGVLALLILVQVKRKKPAH